MKLSIITINFNDRSGLDETIQSVINQTYKDFEYIVIDGGSTDGSVDIIKKHANKLTCWVSEPDTGIYNAMNKGTRLAQGEYCLFLNSGDFLAADDVLEKAFSYNFTEDIVSCNCLEFGDKYESLRIPPKNISLFTFVRGSLPHPTTFIKRNLLESLGGYNENYRIISDWCFFVDATIVHACSYKTLDVLVSKFNCYGISTTSGHTEFDKRRDYLIEKFPRIMNDYLPYYDEAVYNVLQWSQRFPKLNRLMILPCKVLNRVLKLRNKLSVRLGIYPIKLNQ